MGHISIRLLCLAGTLTFTVAASAANMSFNRIASFSTADNFDPTRQTPTSAEIIDASADGMTLIYTDSPASVVGMIDITNPNQPEALGTLALEGEPTAVAVSGTTAYVGVNTSTNYVDTSGHLLAINLDERREVGRCELGGQPDSVAVAADGSFVSIAIENERDEDLGLGRTGQMPAGFLSMVKTTDSGLNCDTLNQIALTGMATVSPEDPEPEFVDINALGETVVTLQENNHIVVISRDGDVVSHFSAGAVDLNGVDTHEEGAIRPIETLTSVKREPDSVKWLDNMHFATANEGDMDGGSRGWTVFNKTGDVVYESGVDFEHALIEIGHYPEERSGNKGVEPESITSATYNGTQMVFVGSERGSAVGVYDISDRGKPVLAQILASGMGPEGYVAIPERNLLISANEEDLIEDDGPRAHVMIFEYNTDTPQYPQLTSAGMDSLTGWGAISGMVGAPNGLIYAVNDSFYSMQPTIFVIDPSTKPAQIVDAIAVTRNGSPAQMLDLEGIALDGNGGFWLASEGDAGDLYPHAIFHVDAAGEIQEQIAYPDALQDIARRHAAEGITRVGDRLWIALQREWDDVPEDHVLLVSYDINSDSWGGVLYPKESASTGWVGMSEISAFDNYVYLIERDNQFGDRAVTKMITRVALSEMEPAPINGDLPIVKKEVVQDLIPALQSFNGYVVDKVEGLAILPSGEAWVSTDNDGVDESSGETFFFSVGEL